MGTGRRWCGGGHVRAVETFPAEERYSLTDQVRRSSQSVCANIAEAWRKRRYPSAFVSKLNDAEAEASDYSVVTEHAFGDPGHSETPAPAGPARGSA